jgi:mono/diheme cytochrome c family protein
MNGAQIIASFESATQAMRAVSRLGASGLAAELYCPFATVEAFQVPKTLTRRRIPVACLVGGAVGAVLAGLLQVYASAISWPLNIGGKPLLSWLAFVPVTFEIMILGAVTGAFVAFLRAAAFTSGPLLEAIDEATRGGRTAVRLSTLDSTEAERATSRLRESGAILVEHPARITRRSVARREGHWSRVKLGLAAAVGVSLLAAVIIRTEPTRPNFVFAPDMFDSPAAVSYSREALWADADTLRERPRGSVSRGPLPLRYGPGEDEAARAGLELTMPAEVAGEPDTARGEALFSALCQTCHGEEGHGDGVTMRKGFQPPASLLTQQARDMEDGRMFHVVTFGQNLMPPHAGQMSERDRWRVIRFVRSLQQSLPVDPPPFEPATTRSGEDR